MLGVPREQVLTKAFTAALMNAGGDLFAQLMFEKKSEVDWKRLATFTFLVRPPPRSDLKPDLKPLKSSQTLATESPEAVARPLFLLNTCAHRIWAHLILM